MWLNRILERRSETRGNTERTDEVGSIRLDQYPYDLVSAECVDNAALEIVEADALGFEHLKKRIWVRKVTPDIFQLLSLTATKGAGYVFRWGVSTTYLPHDWDPKPKFHRTLKSARYDLFEDAGEFIVRDPYSEESRFYLVEGLRGEEALRKTLRRTWNKLRPYLQSWFSEAASLEGVLTKAQTQVSHHWRSFRHFPDPKLVVAFTLARIGRIDEARETLRGLVSEIPESYGSSVLADALEFVCGLSNPQSS